MGNTGKKKGPKRSDNQEAVQLQERQLLKSEMQDLKACQVRYLSIAVTATGVMLGFGQKFGDAIPYYLAPLVIILPCWVVFFDKATSITRITGYSKYLEAFLQGLDTNTKYVGWENALSIFRQRQQRNATAAPLRERFWQSLHSARSGLQTILRFEFPYRYWKITWLTFAALTILCLGLALRTGWRGGAETDEWFAFAGSVVITVLVALHTLYLLEHLVSGKFSYKQNSSEWGQCLDANEVEEYIRRELQEGSKSMPRSGCSETG
ncbi:MAG TPA: hypothetical protein ENJ84_15375 [Gammaproteobacteria bacterium]|nr:hypothetical protein [Gammaproteobacteria bacterium]